MKILIVTLMLSGFSLTAKAEGNCHLKFFNGPRLVKTLDRTLFKVAHSCPVAAMEAFENKATPDEEKAPITGVQLNFETDDHRTGEGSYGITE